MPFNIVKDDIKKIKADSLVVTANTPTGNIAVGEAVIKTHCGLKANYVIHTLEPTWQGGKNSEEELLKKCYENSLKLALDNECESIAFPLLSTENSDFPKPLALQIATSVFNEFLTDHEMQIYLSVQSKDAFSPPKELLQAVQSYIDEKYIDTAVFEKCEAKEVKYLGAEKEPHFPRLKKPRYESVCAAPEILESVRVPGELENLLSKTDAGFSETLLKLIDKTGKKDSEIYKKANIDRKLFSKIRNNPDYKPSKPTALAFAIALELNLQETKDFIARAGFALSHSSEFDIIIEYFISNGNYDMFEINETLFVFDQNLLGA